MIFFEGSVYHAATTGLIHIRHTSVFGKQSLQCLHLGSLRGSEKSLYVNKHLYYEFLNFPGKQ